MICGKAISAALLIAMSSGDGSSSHHYVETVSGKGFPVHWKWVAKTDTVSRFYKNIEDCSSAVPIVVTGNPIDCHDTSYWYYTYNRQDLCLINAERLRSGVKVRFAGQDDPGALMIDFDALNEFMHHMADLCFVIVSEALEQKHIRKHVNSRALPNVLDFELHSEREAIFRRKESTWKRQATFEPSSILHIAYRPSIASQLASGCESFPNKIYSYRAERNRHQPQKSNDPLSQRIARRHQPAVPMPPGTFRVVSIFLLVGFSSAITLFGLGILIGRVLDLRCEHEKDRRKTKAQR